MKSLVVDKIGLKTKALLIAGFILGLAINFNSTSFWTFIGSGTASGIAFGYVGFVLDNFQQRWKKFVSLAVLLPVIGVGFAFYLAPTVCGDMYMVVPDLAKHPVTGEMEHRVFTSSSTCGTFEFPWYYRSPNDEEVFNYCEDNPDKLYCVENVEEVEPVDPKSHEDYIR